MFNKEDKENHRLLKEYLSRGTFPLTAAEVVPFQKVMHWVIGLEKKFSQAPIVESVEVVKKKKTTKKKASK